MPHTTSNEGPEPDALPLARPTQLASSPLQRRLLPARGWSVRTRMLGLALSVVLPFVGMIAYGLVTGSHEALERAQRETGQIAESGAREMTTLLSQTEHTLATIAYRPQVQNLDPHACDFLHTEFDTLLPAFQDLDLRDRSGRLICSSSLSGLSVGILPAADLPADADQFRFGDPVLLPTTHRWVNTTTYPVRDASTQVAGTLYLHGDQLNLQRAVLRNVPGDVVVALFDQNARYLMRSAGGSDVIGTASRDPERLKAMIRERFRGFERLSGVDGVARVYAYAPVPQMQGMVVAGVPEDAVFAPLRTRLLEGLIVGPFALLIGVFLAFRLSASIAGPIDDLQRTANRVVEGDLVARASLRGPSEIASVALKLNRMLDVHHLVTHDLQEAEQRFIGVVHSALDAIIIVDAEYRIVQLNPAAEALFAQRASEAIWGPLVQLFPQRLQQELIDYMAACDAGSARTRLGEGLGSFFALRARVDEFPVELSVSTSLLGGEKFHTLIVRDMTERVAADKRERTQKNFYAALSQTNQAIVRIREPLALYREICRLCVAYGHARMAYIGIIEGQRISPVAWSGPAEEFLAAIDLRLDPNVPEGRGPIANAIRKGSPYICNDFYADPNTIPWRVLAAKIGTRSTAAFPFRRGGLVVGIISLHVAEKDFFNDELIDLLVEMTGDITFALDNFEREAARTASERESHRAHKRFEQIILGAPEPMAVSEMESGRIVLVNDEFCEILGYSRQALIGQTAKALGLWADPMLRERVLDAIRRGDLPRGMDARLRTGAGELRDVRLSADSIDLGSEAHLLLMFTDVTERKRADARVIHLATHDSLTGLPNGSLIQDRIAEAIETSRVTGRPMGVLYLDLDRFKVVNDSFGHRFGDAVLKAVAERLSLLLCSEDCVARQSGDEFVVILREIQNLADCYNTVQKVLDAFDEPLLVRDREVFVTMSAGVSLYPKDGRTADELIGNADVAMYRSKDLRRGTYQFFSSAMSESTRLHGDLERDLRGAVSHGQMRLAYQPKVDLTTGRITGVETLLRWKHPERGEIAPAQFIPIAEESGLIVPIGNWVLRSACRQNKAWLDAGYPPVVISVNVSARQFLQQDVVTWVLAALNDTGLPAELLELELTESLLAQDTENVIVSMDRLKATGVKLSIDDFGTGYSSLSYLKRFKVDTLKIDQTFIRDMMRHADDATIPLAIIALAHQLRLRVIAEGTETLEQCLFLRDHGCDEVQGYYVSRPVPAEQFEAMLAQDGPVAPALSALVEV